MSRRLRGAIIRAAREMERRGLVVGSVGNISSRSRDRVLITPTMAAYGGMRQRDLVTTTMSGRVVRGRRNPSRELPLHLLVYERRPDVRAVVHTHSPFATAWSFTGIPLEPGLEESIYFATGLLRCAPPAPAGSIDLAHRAADALGSSRAVLLGGHGVLAIGQEPADALLIARVVEHTAQVAWLMSDAARPSRFAV